MGDSIKAHPRLSASQSFTPEEVSALDELFRGLLIGKDVRMMARSAPMISVMRKVQVMQRSIERLKGERK